MDPLEVALIYLMDAVALRLHSGARTELYQEDPRSQNRDLDWIRKKASAILERVLRFGAERLRDQEKPYEDYRM